MRHLSLVAITGTLLLSSMLSIGQSTADEANDEPKIVNSWRTLQYNGPAITVTLKQRKYDPPLFCDEMIPYKKGYIINSITSNRAGRTIDVTTRFYYIDLATKQFSKLKIANADTIEAIVADANKLYYAAIQNGHRTITSLESGTKQELYALAPGDIKTALDTAHWVKLGYANQQLYALTPLAVYGFSGNQWKQVVSYSLDSFYTQILHYKRSRSILPTRNITVAGNNIWFLQEIVQERSSDLFKLDLNTGKVTDLFKSLDYTDNYHKVINDYTILPDQSLLVNISRLMYTYMTLRTTGQQTDVWLFQSKLNTPTGKLSNVSFTCGEVAGDTIFLAGPTGLYAKKGDVITPLLLWENGNQEIKEGKTTYVFEWEPRSLKVLPNQQFLVGGLWGSLLLVDVAKRQVQYLDDIAYKRIKQIELSDL